MNRMRTSFAVLTGVLAIAGSRAGAQTVSYSTSGSFTGCAVVGSVCTITGSAGGTATLTFTGSGAQTFGTPITGATLGTFSLASVGTAANELFSFSGIGFNLTVNQTGPTGGMAMPTATLSGSFRNNPISGGPVTLSFLTPSFAIGPAIYSIVQAGQIPLRLPATGGVAQVTDLQASINVVPEPSTYALLATGIAGLGLVARRRRTQG